MKPRPPEHGLGTLWTLSERAVGGVTLHRTNSYRDVRAATMALSCWIEKASQRVGIALFDQPRLDRTSVVQEVEAMKRVLRKDIANRLFVAWRQLNVVEGLPADVSPEAIEAVAFAESSEALPRRPSGHSYHHVFAALLRDWLRGEKPRTRKEIQAITGFTQAPVDKVLKDLSAWIELGPRKRVGLRALPREPWRRVVAHADAARETVRFIDPTGIARSPASLVKRLRSLGRPHVAIGGVIGAQHYDPSLDLVGIPRVDLTVHQERGDVDLSFISDLDPAIRRSAEPREKAALVIHVLRRHEAMFETRDDGMLIADPVECLLDLHDLRLNDQAEQFVKALRSGTGTN